MASNCSTSARSSKLSPGNTVINIGKCDSKEVVKHVQLKWKVVFCSISFAVFTSLLVKLPLFLARQLVPRLSLPILCPGNNASQPRIGQEYIFTTVIYSTLFIGRSIECLILQILMYKFFFKHCTASEVDEFKELCIRRLTTNKWMTFSFIGLSIYMLVHSLSIPALGIALEIKSGRESRCTSYIYEYHTVYWILDIIRYLYDVAIRLFMVLATMAVGVIWSGENLISQSVSRTQTTVCSPGHESNNSCPGEPKNYREYLEDREITSIDHSKRWQEYVRRGKRVEYILEIFQTWFIIPWILYFVSSSLSTDHILQSWKDGSSGDGQYDFSEVAYMVYNFNQLFLLTLPYLCSKKMNADHCNYIFNSRKQQLEGQGTASRMAFAHMNKIEEEDHFNFVPRIWGTSIKIEVENPLYIMFLLIGIIFTVVEALI